MLVSKAHPYGWVNNEKLRSKTITDLDSNIYNLQNKLSLQNFIFTNAPLGQSNWDDLDFGTLSLDIGTGSEMMTTWFAAGDFTTESLVYSFNGYQWVDTGATESYKFVKIATAPGISLLFLAKWTPTSTVKLAYMSPSFTFFDVTGPNHGDTVAASAIHYSTRLGLLVASYPNGRIDYVDDGTPGTATAATVPSAWDTEDNFVNKFAESPTSIVGVPTSFDNRFIRTTDGINWTAITAPSVATWQVAYTNNRYMAVNDASAVYTSIDDGLTWQSSNPVTLQFFTGLTTIGDLFIAVSGDSEAIYIYYSDDFGKTWHKYVMSWGTLPFIKQSQGSIYSLVTYDSVLRFVRSINLWDDNPVT